MLDDLGLEEGDFDLPSGAMGMAFFGTRDADSGAPGVGLMFSADYGDKAENMERFFKAAFAKGEEAKEIAIEEKTVMGRTVLAIGDARSPRWTRPTTSAWAAPSRCSRRWARRSSSSARTARSS